MIEPAAPYVDPGSLCPRYNPSANLATTNRIEVRNAPGQTFLHFIFASGRNLKIAANSSVTTLIDTTMSRKLNTTANASEKFHETQLLTAPMAADITNETSSKNPTARMSPNENSRSLISARIFCFVFTSCFTSHILFNICCN